MEIISHYSVWLVEAKAAGFEVELDGSGKMVAHQDGVEMGIWDNCYGGSGAGWFRFRD